MEIWSNYSISFTNSVDPVDINMLYEWIKNEANDKKWQCGLDFLTNDNGKFMSPEDFSKIVKSNEKYEVPESNLYIYDFRDFLQSMAEAFPQINYEAFIYCNDCTSGITEQGDFSCIDGKFFEEITSAEYEDEDSWDEDC